MDVSNRTTKMIASPMTLDEYRSEYDAGFIAPYDPSTRGYVFESWHGDKCNRRWTKSNPFVSPYYPDFPDFKMKFGHALSAMKEGRNVRRSGWENHLFLHHDGFIAESPDIMDQEWLPSTEDMLADDWVLFDEA